ERYLQNLRRDRVGERVEVEARAFAQREGQPRDEERDVEREREREPLPPRLAPLLPEHRLKDVTGHSLALRSRSARTVFTKMSSSEIGRTSGFFTPRSPSSRRVSSPHPVTVRICS